MAGPRKYIAVAETLVLANLRLWTFYNIGSPSHLFMSPMLKTRSYPCFMGT